MLQYIPLHTELKPTASSDIVIVPDAIAYDMWLPGKRRPVIIAISSHRKTKFPQIALKDALRVGQLYPDTTQAVKFATSSYRDLCD